MVTESVAEVIAEIQAAGGLSEETILRQTLIAPSCGTGSLSVAQAVKVLSLTTELSAGIRNCFGIAV